MKLKIKYFLIYRKNMSARLNISDKLVSKRELASNVAMTTKVLDEHKSTKFNNFPISNKSQRIIAEYLLAS